MNMSETGWVVVVIALFGIAIIMFIQDLRRVLLGRPIKIWFFNEIYSDDLLYPVAVIRVLGPYLILFVMMLRIAGAVAFAAL